MQKIVRTRNVAFIPVGRAEAGYTASVSGLLAAGPPAPAVSLDLEDLVLVDRDTVRFLRTREGDGMVLRNRAQFIRVWVKREEER